MMAFWDAQVLFQITVSLKNALMIAMRKEFVLMEDVCVGPSTMVKPVKIYQQ